VAWTPTCCSGPGGSPRSHYDRVRCTCSYCPRLPRRLCQRRILTDAAAPESHPCDRQKEAQDESARAKRAAVRRLLLQTARRLLEEHGYHGVGLETVAAEAGMSRQSIYIHFRSKARPLIAASHPTEASPPALVGPGGTAGELMPALLATAVTFFPGYLIFGIAMSRAAMIQAWVGWLLVTGSMLTLAALQRRKAAYDHPRLGASGGCFCRAQLGPLVTTPAILLS
jgi:Bacterial regulatory proteins, tetR family